MLTSPAVPPARPKSCAAPARSRTPTATTARTTRRTCSSSMRAWRLGRRRRRRPWRWLGASWPAESWGSWPFSASGTTRAPCRWGRAARRAAAAVPLSAAAAVALPGCWAGGRAVAGRHAERIPRCAAVSHARAWRGCGRPAPALPHPWWWRPTPSVQIYVDKARLEAAQPGGFAMLKGSVDVGDIVGATGSVKRTEKGELSVVANSLQASWRVAVPRRCEGVGQHCTLPMQPRQGELLGAPPPPPPRAGGCVCVCVRVCVSLCVCMCVCVWVHTDNTYTHTHQKRMGRGGFRRGASRLTATSPSRSKSSQ